MKSNARKRLHLRIVLVAVSFSLAFGLIAAKAIYVQVFLGDWLSKQAASEYERSVSTQGKRGIIYDRHHHELAVSIDVTSIAAFTGRVTDKAKAAKALAGAIDVDRKTIQRKLASQSPFVWIKRQVSPKEAQAVRRLAIDGIDFVPEHSRFYPNRTLAAQLLGFVGTDGNGLEGLEFYYDRYLQGSSEQLKVLKDALNRQFNPETVAAEDFTGKNLVLTIDRNIQYIAEKALEEAVTQYKGRSGMAVVMAPRTGAVLAMAHYPFFNPNTFRRYRRDQWRNRTITDPFEPGSTMKIFLAAAALESGNMTPNTIYFCENGALRIGRNVVHDTHPHGWLSLQQIVKYSSNIGAVKVGEKLGRKTLHDTLTRFGFGQRTGIDCPGETTGSLSGYKRWTRIDAGAISFGQGIAVSAIQLAAAAAAIANDGVMMKPFLVQAVTDSNGKLLHSFSPTLIRRVVSERTARTLRRIMHTVVTEGGTGEKAALQGYRVGGKTGTAQKIDAKGTYAADKYLASFIGFAPIERPEVVVLVVVDEPHPIHYGGIVAAPAFQKIAQESLVYLGVPPNGSPRSGAMQVSWEQGAGQ